MIVVHVKYVATDQAEYDVPTDEFDEYAPLEVFMNAFCKKYKIKTNSVAFRDSEGQTLTPAFSADYFDLGNGEQVNLKGTVDPQGTTYVPPPPWPRGLSHGIGLGHSPPVSPGGHLQGAALGEARLRF
jgi:hypothetical protein